MVFGLWKSAHREPSAGELGALVCGGWALVVDVREPEEFAGGHLPGATNMLLSAFDPARLPHRPGQTLVLNCAAGRRSALALEQCAAAQASVDTHLAGGFGAWKAAGLPVER